MSVLMGKKWHPLELLTSSVGKLAVLLTYTGANVPSSPIVVLHVHRIRIINDTGLGHYKLRVTYAECHFSQDDDDVVESFDPSNVFSVRMCLFFHFSVSAGIQFSLSQIYICLMHSDVSVSERFQYTADIWLATVLPPFRLLQGLSLIRHGGFLSPS